MKKYVFGGAAILFLSIGAWMIGQRLTHSDMVISTGDVQTLMTSDTNHVVLDVRTEAEFQGETGHLAGALLIPVQDLAARLHELESHRTKLIVAVCRSGNRSGHATAFLIQKGFRALNMTGGMIRWNGEGRPVTHEKRP